MLAFLWFVAPQALPAFADDKAVSLSTRQEGLAKQYNEAKKYAERLEQEPELGKSRDNWLQGLRNFRKIYLSERESAHSSPSLFMMASLSQQMYARFQVPLDLNNSIDFFLELADRYPASSLADDALYSAAESIRRHRPEDPQPLEIYQRIVDVYPKGNFHDRAQERIRQDKQKSTPRGSRPVTPVLARDPGYQLARILPVKYWSSADYTRVVIQSSAPVHFDSRLLEKDGDRPRRLYLDFTPSIIQPAVRKPIVIQDGLLKQIRTARFDNSTVRVVLDLESLSDYKIFSLNDPFRVIVDVHGVRPSREEQRATLEYRERLEAALQKTPESLEEPPSEESQPLQEVREIPEKRETAVQEMPLEPPGVRDESSIPKDLAKARLALVQLHDQKKTAPGAARTRASQTPAARDRASTGEVPIQAGQARIGGVPIKQAEARTARGTAAPRKGNEGLTIAQQLGLGVRRIVVDPGHGGKDPGAMGFGLKEKDIVLKVSKKMAAVLREKDFEVELTRSTDIHIPLEERTAIANMRNADLFVSVHINAHPDKKIGGVETYFLNLATDAEAMRVAALENATSTHNISELQDILSNLMNNSKIDESSRLAHFVQTNLASGLKKQYKIRDLGVKQAPFYVLIGAEMPAILVEISFITNQEEARLLQSEEYLNTIAERIASGIAAYVRHHQSAALRFQ